MLLFFNFYPHRPIEGYLQRIFRANVFMWRPEMGSWTWSPKKRLGGTAKNHLNQTQNIKNYSKVCSYIIFIPKKYKLQTIPKPWFVWWDEKAKKNTNKTFFTLFSHVF